jgi:hypothetical protein
MQIDVEELQSTAIRSDLSDDEKKRVLSGLGWLGNGSAIAHFSQSNGNVATQQISISVPQGTLSAYIFPSNWVFHFGRGVLIERPIGQFGLSVGITSFIVRELKVDVRAVLRNLKPDDPWGADVTVVAVGFG